MQTKQHAYIGKIYGGNISSQINQQAYKCIPVEVSLQPKAHKTLSFLHENPSAPLLLASGAIFLGKPLPHFCCSSPQQHGLLTTPLQLHASCRRHPALSWGPLPSLKM